MKYAFGLLTHLDVVAESRKQLDGALRPVSVVVAVLEIRTVLEFLFGRQVEDFLADGELAIDFLLAEAEIGDVEEADFVDSIAKLVRELLFATWRVELREIERDQVGPGYCMWLQ